VNDMVERWREGVESGDAHVAAEALADDVKLVSPLTDRFAFRGRNDVEELLTGVFEVFTGIRFAAELRQGDLVVLRARGTVGKLDLEETQFLDLERGLIRHVTIMMRPLPAITHLLRGLAPRVARRRGLRATSLLLGAASALPDTVVASGDRVFMPLADPARTRGGSIH